ncbi:S8 family serine peptidase [Agromyces sp. SYSU K20354]|uniref:S8 family peptidase n=1 Tax=Agromyces cavernae TaxID=2898659 RepID=UPI001E621DB6|nr:S8 family peptidase [Agromyces cavernae]MCD2441446.1 S8 family serine peptidase [Agromyces cavernae]
MGLIDGKEPKPIATPDVQPRVVVKVTDEARRERGLRDIPPHQRAGEQEDDIGVALIEATAYLGDVIADFQKRVAGEAHLDSLVGDDERRSLGRGRRARFDGYAAITVPDAASAEQLVKELNARDDVETAYVEGGPTPPPGPPPVNAGDDPRNTNQGYLDAAPGGIDARWAWGAADGAGIGFVDLEQGWTLNHEDLTAAGVTIISGVSQAYHGHGTAVLGEVVATDNTRGGVGIAPGASARVVSQYRTTFTYSTSAAIISAADAMSPGDVMLLEAQTTAGGSSTTYLPVEVEQAVFDAIRDAVDAGIVVVEAAGNGGNDLDDWTDAQGRHLLRIGDPDYRDSGAIMVGAATSTHPHSRLGFSNHGSRIDCFAWGQNVDTTGDGWTGTSTTQYTGVFGGTSSASPIVTGAAVLLQSWRRARKGFPLGPEAVRSWLRSGINTPSADPATDRIGVMPNLRAIFEAIGRNDRFGRIGDRYVAWVYILFGVIDDAPGVVWVPGKGPVPVDPEWRDAAIRGRRELVAAIAREARKSDGRLTAKQLDRIASVAFKAFKAFVG